MCANPASGAQHYVMATTLPSANARIVVRCDLCLLVQFQSASNVCRRCRISLDATAEPAPGPTPAPPHHQMTCAPSANLPATARALRLRRGLSQRALGRLMAVPRTYISKIENGNALPTLPSLVKLASALEVNVAELLVGHDQGRQEEIAELSNDPFVADMLPFVAKLSDWQRRAVLDEAALMARRRIALGGPPSRRSTAAA